MVAQPQNSYRLIPIWLHEGNPTYAAHAVQACATLHSHNRYDGYGSISWASSGHLLSDRTPSGRDQNMADPFTILGIVTNIIQLVEFGLKTCQKVHQLAESGTTSEHQYLESLVQTNLSLLGDLQAKTVKDPEDHEAGLQDLTVKTKSVADDLEGLLQRLSLNSSSAAQPRPRKRQRREVVAKYVKGLWYEKDVQRLQCKLKGLQQELMLSMVTQQK